MNHTENTPRFSALAIAVIGANYGDEGKGCKVDQLCALPAIAGVGKTCVVRFNGGGQAGHTVQLATGQRHVFSQLGSGSFQGASTFLSRHFLFDPIGFAFELASFLKAYYQFAGNHAPTPQVYIHEDVQIITPFDSLLNQIRERVRESGQPGAAHGSCGKGIGATMERIKAGVTFTAKDLLRPYSVPAKLQEVLSYVKEQSISGKKVGDYLSAEPVQEMSMAMYDALNCMQDMKSIWSVVSTIDLPKFDTFVFEGAQGLLLDQDNKEHFPHVTYSHTGLKNVAEVLKELGSGVQLTNVFYCTRPYLTRHGNGPILAGKECAPEELGMSASIDKTNVTNKWQGPLRFATLDIPALIDRIKADVQSVSITPQFHACLSVSCENHAPALTQRLLNAVDTFETNDIIIQTIEESTHVTKFIPSAPPPSPSAAVN